LECLTEIRDKDGGFSKLVVVFEFVDKMWDVIVWLVQNAGLFGWSKMQDCPSQSGTCGQPIPMVNGKAHYCMKPYTISDILPQQ
jgi:hypothetical protein